MITIVKFFLNIAKVTIMKIYLMLILPQCAKEDAKRQELAKSVGYVIITVDSISLYLLSSVLRERVSALAIADIVLVCLTSAFMLCSPGAPTVAASAAFSRHM